MEVKPLRQSSVQAGYKQTEVGVIPEEWEVGALESVARIIDPQPDHRTPPETAGGEPYIGISDFIDDCTVKWDSSRKIVSRAVDKQQLSFQVGPGNIIFGKIGTIGSPKFLPTVPFRFGLSANVLLIQPRIEPNFVMSWLRSKPCQRAVTGELHSTSQAAFGINKMRRVMIPLPPETEQRAIATALSDADGLLGGLDRLIAKKRDLKQAAMQQLLTGQTRLPGFHGEWEVKELGDVAMLMNGYAFKSDTYISLGTFKVITIANVQDGYMTADACNTIASEPADLQPHQRLRRGDILISMTGNVGRVCRVDEDHCLLNQRVGKLVPVGIVEALLFVLLGQPSFISSMTGVAKGGAQPNLSASDITEHTFNIPKDAAEQIAIAEVLTDMDLAALEQRREKTRALKQAMMQELLTGRTRLVSGADVTA
jgi:type I restriction enzyme S subunit